MTEMDKHWLAGVMDSRGTISVTRSGNVTGTVTLNLNSELMKDLVCSLISEEVICNPATLVGKTYKLNFTASHGTVLLEMMRPYMRNIINLRRADVYAEIFPEESKGKHMKLNRLDGYAQWLRMLRSEVSEHSHLDVVNKIKGV